MVQVSSVSRHLARWALVLGLMVIISFGVLAQGSGGWLTIVLRGDISTLDPAHLLDSQSSHVGEQIYEGLVKYDTDGDIVPCLAKSWDFSEDGVLVTFHLRRGVKFHDGTDFNADVVKFNYDRLMDPEVASYSHDTHANTIESVEVLDSYTVRFTLFQPNVTFLEKNVLSDDALMISPTLVGKYGYTDTGLHNAGTGPWKFLEYKEAQYVKLVPFEEYWGDVPLLDGLIFRPIPETEAGVIELLTGGVDLLMAVTSESLPRLEAADNLVIERAPNSTIRGLWFQFEHFPPFGDVLVRRALLYGLDRHGIVEAFLSGVALPLDTMVPLQSWAYNPDVLTYPYDPEKAKTLLEEAGWVDVDGDRVREKDGQELAFTIASSDGRYLADKEICTAAAHAWSEIGAKVDVEVYEWGAYISKLWGAEFTHDMCFLGWLQLSLDPTLFIDDMARTGGSGNRHNYSNSEIDQLLSKAAIIFDKKVRKPLYYEVEQLLHNDAMWIPLYNQLGIVAYTSDLKGFSYSPFMINDFTQAYLER